MRFDNLKIVGIIPIMIYTLTTIANHGKNAIRNKRFWGYCLTEADALNAIRDNTDGMENSLYDYLVLETYEPGINAMATSERWFKWGLATKDWEVWYEIDKPAWSNGIVNWAMV